MKRLPVGLIVLFSLPGFFFLSVSAVIIFSSFFILSNQKSLIVSAASPSGDGLPKAVYNLFSAPPPVLGALTTTVTAEDARSLVLQQFFSNYHSPLASYGEVFIREAEKHEIPWQLLPAISMQESIGGKNSPDDCFNAFGWGIHSRGTLCFGSWEEGIEKVSQGIKEKYIDQGLRTINEIMSRYNPISYGRDGSWANGVQFFLQEIESFSTP